MTEGPREARPTATGDPTESVVGDSATVAVWTLASRVTGFLRVFAIAGILGPTFLGNLFGTVNVLPWIIYEFAVGDLLGSIVMPALVASDLESRAAFSRAGSALLSAVVVVFGAISTVLVLGAPVTARLLGVLLASSAPRSAYFDAAVPLLMVTGPQILGYGLIALFVAVQNARGRFALPAAAPVVENLVVLAAMGLFAVVEGTRVGIDEVSTTGLVILGGGSTLGVLSHLGLQLHGTRRVGAGLRFGSLRHRAVRSAARKARTAALASSMNASRLVVPLVVTQPIQGGTVAYQLAQNMVSLPFALGGRSVVAAFVPRASLLASRARWDAFVAEYRRARSVVLVVIVPASFGMLAMAPWLADAFSIGEMATGQGPHLLRAALASLAAAVIGAPLAHLAVTTSFVRGRPSIAAREMSVRLIITVVGLAVAWWRFEGSGLLIATGLVLSVADLAGALVASAAPRRGLVLAPMPAEVPPSPRRTVLAAAITFIPIGVIAWSVEVPLGVAPVSTLAVAGLGLAALGAYATIRWRLEAVEMSNMVAELRR